MKRGVLVLLSLFGIAVVAVLVILFVRGRDTAPTEKTLRVWIPFDEVSLYQELTEDFAVANPTTKLEFRYIDAKDAKEYEAKVVNAIADGEGPDVWMVRSDWIPKHAPKSLAAVTTNPEEDPVALAKTKLEPAIVDLNVHEGKLYGLPMTADSLMIIYNVDLYNNVASAADANGQRILGKTPVTWADFVEQSAVVSKKKDATIQQSAVALGTVDTTFAPSDVLTALLTQAGVEILTEDKKNVGFNLAKFKAGEAQFPATEALQFYTSFATPGASNYSWNDTMGNAVDAFLAGKTGALIGYYSTLQTIIKREPNFTLRIAPLIQKQEKTERVDYGVSWSFIVNSETTQANTAWSLLSYLSEEILQLKYSEKTNRPPASIFSNSTPIEPALKTTSQATELVRQQLRSVKSLTKPEWQLVDEVFQDAIRQVVTLGKTPQNSADSAAERFKVFVP